MEKQTKIKDLPKEKRAGYIWDYYKFHIIGTVLAIIFIGSLIKSVTTNKDPLLSIIMTNSDVSVDDTALYEYFDDRGLSYFDDAISLANGFYFDENNASASYNEYMVIGTYIAAGSEDIFIGTGQIFENYAEQGAFLDLREFLSEETLEKYSDCIIYSDSEGETEEYPCALYLKDNNFLMSAGYYNTPVYVGVLVNAPCPDTATDFVNWMLEK